MITTKDGHQRKRKQRTLFCGPGAVKAKIKDNKNRVHYLPLDIKTIEAITENKNVATLSNVCPKCGRTFANEQGLGGHLIQ